MKVALVVVDITSIDLPISQYTAFTLESKRNGGQMLASAAIVSTRTGYFTRTVYLLLSRFWYTVHSYLSSAFHSTSQTE